MAGPARAEAAAGPAGAGAAAASYENAMDPNQHHILLEEKNNNFAANPRSDCAMLPMQDQQAVKPDHQHSDIEMRTETEKTT